MTPQEVGALRKQLWANGYRPVPVLSHTDPDPKKAGKCPLGRKWQLAARRTPPEVVQFDTAVTHALNTGLLTDTLRAVDCDCDAAGIANAIEELCIEHLGAAPIRRRDNSNRFAMLYKAAAGSPHKRTLQGSAGRLEVLGHGQQIVCHGTHVSGGVIYWTGPEPLDMPVDKLPVVSEAQISEFFVAAAPIIVAAEPARRRGNGASDTAEGNVDLARIIDALAAIPADDYTTWITVGCAVHHATNGSNVGCAIWDEWSSHSTKYDADVIAEKWNSFGNYEEAERVGPGTIFHFAQQHSRLPASSSEPDVAWEEARPPAEAAPPQARRRRRTGEAPPYTPADPTNVWDPWEDPPPPQWPNSILSHEAENALALVSLRDGIDLGIIAMSFLAAASAAAPKNARFFPYGRTGTTWSVPPIMWVMLIGESGVRKTILDAAFAPLRKAQLELWRPYSAALHAWRRLPATDRGPKPEEPHSFIIDDATPESVQCILSNTNRGTALIKDEIAGMFEFGRYRQGGHGEAARAFYLTAYEDAPYTVHRVGRDSAYIEHAGLSTYGNIQPSRLAAFEGLETDGLLQRFAPLRANPAAAARADIDPGPGLTTLHRAIERLCYFEGLNYTTMPEGTALIQETERAARGYSIITDFSAGWPAFCRKLHGTHARLALILHLLETPDVPTIATDTVERAHRLVHGFVLQHAHDFYASVPGSNHERLRDIAGWLLTRQDRNATANQFERIVASDLTNNVKACRPLGSKGIADALDPFVTRGWLIPENDFPGNRAWLFDPTIRTALAERQKAERERRVAIRAEIDRLKAGRRS